MRKLLLLMIFVLTIFHSGILMAQQNTTYFTDIGGTFYAPASFKAGNIDFNLTSWTGDNASFVSPDSAYVHLLGADLHGVFYAGKITEIRVILENRAPDDSVFLFIYGKNEEFQKLYLSSTFFSDMLVFNVADGFEFNHFEISGKDAIIYEVSIDYELDFYLSANHICPGEKIYVSVDAYLSSLEWDFGDGSPVNYNSNAEHTYMIPGEYTISCRYYDMMGMPDTIQKIINVDTTTRPMVEFMVFNNGMSCPGDHVRFETHSNYLGHVWKFGDGTDFIENEKSVSHAFMAPGNYPVTLVAANICGNIDSLTIPIEISNQALANASFDIDIHDPCPFDKISMHALNSGNFLWRFDDGEMAYDPNVLHAFKDTGVYNITLINQNACGNRDTMTQKISVMYHPDRYSYMNLMAGFKENGADYYNEYLMVCPGTEVAFGNKSFLTEGSKFWWDFGDSTAFSYQFEPSHVYTKPGYYSPRFVVENNCGANQEYWLSILVNDTLTPQSFMSVVPQSICPGEEVFIYDENFSQGNAYTYFFDYGDGNISEPINQLTETEPKVLATHKYFTEGEYVITSTITNICGNTLTEELVVNVTPDSTRVPYYFVMNTASFDEYGPADWSKPSANTDHLFKVSFDWSSYNAELNDDFYVLFWFGGVYPYDGMSSADGYVKVKGNNKTVDAYVPIVPDANVIGVAVAWYCSGVMTGEPSAFGLPLDQDSVEIKEFPLEPNGQTSTFTIDLAEWTGPCYPSYENISGLFKTADLGGYRFEINFNNLETKYEISKRFIDNRVEFIERGYYSVYEAYLSFYPDYQEILNQCNQSFEYQVSFLNGVLQLEDGGDNCTIRSTALTSAPFNREADEELKGGVCPNDPVYFQVVGGVNHVWDFTTHQVSGTLVSNTFSTLGEYTVALYASNACNRTDTIYTYVNVGNQFLPKAEFRTSGDYIIAGQGIQFKPNSDFLGAEQYTYEWSFGDGAVSLAYYAEHFYDIPGKYMVNLRVTNGCGSSEFQREVVVMDKPSCKAQFEYFYDMMDETVYFYNYSNGNISNYFWEFGDGTQSYDLYPSHKYADAGVYQVCLTVNDTINNCINTQCENIFVGEVNCFADFYYFINQETNEVSFSDISTGNISSYYWDFGDGNFSNAQNPTYQYAPGRYTVCLTIFDEATGCQDYRCYDIMVGEVSCYPEFISFSNGLSVEFQNQSVGAQQHYWDFGDGSFSSEKNPAHTYDYPGYYWVYYSIYNDSTQCFGEMWREVVVMDTSVEWSSCKADFYEFIDPTTNTVNFYNESYGSVTQIYWDFGDRTYSTEFNPLHEYAQPGFYTVCLSIKDSIGECSASFCKEIKVESTSMACKADFGIVKGTEPGAYKFLNQSSTGAYYYWWDFGDGNYSEAENPTHQYTFTGYYPVYLAVFDTLTGCFADAFEEIYVESNDSVVACKADFSYFIDPATSKVEFKSEVKGNITNWYWTFGDGTYSEEVKPVHQYAFGGVFEVSLFVFDEATGCYASSSKTISIGVMECNIIADIGYMVNTESKKVSFSDKTIGNHNIYYWDFGDGNTSLEKNPSHIYSNPGFYLVSFNALDSLSGCNDFAAAFIQVGAMDCKAAFETKVDVANLKVQFINNSKANHYNFWSFGNGDYSDEVAPLYQYNGSGKYYTALAIGDESGICWDYTEAIIQVGEVVCDAFFTASVNPNTKEVKFTNKNQSKSNYLYWQFGDGGISTDVNPVYKYTYPGYYLVSLYTYNENGSCMDYHEELILVGNQGDDCEADFFYQSNPETRVVNFTDKSKGEGLSYFWYFGEGEASSTLQNPSFTYVDPGYKYVCLTVTNAAGISNMTCKDVNVGEGCLAQFDFVVDGLKVTFNDKSIGSPSEWTWDFGDGSEVSTEQNPVHSFTEAGNYMIDFSITNANGCDNRFVNIITVGAANDTTFAVNFAYTVDSTGSKPSGYPVDMFGTGKGDAPTAKWKFGEKQKGGYAENETTLRPTFTYTEPGTYEVCLTISDPITLKSATACKNIKVGDVSSVDPVFGASELIIYPNPASSFTRLSYNLSQNADVKIVVYDIEGKKIQDMDAQQQFAGANYLDVDVSNLPSGNYFIDIFANQSKLTQKLVVKK